MNHTPPARLPFVGRQAERAAYQQFLREERGPWLLDIYGQGGNGKSRLLKQFWDDTPRNIQTRLLDFANEYLHTDVLSVAEAVGECLKPLVDARSFQTFQQEARAGRKRLVDTQISLSQQITVNTNADAQGLAQSMNASSLFNEMRRQVEFMVTEALLEMARAARGHSLTLMLDTCEWFHEPGCQEVGVWVKNTLPRLRERMGTGLRVVAAGRERLQSSAMNGEARSLSLDLLPQADLEHYLRQVGMQDARLRQAVYAMTQGHPLCLTIVADLWQERPFTSADLPAFQETFSVLAVMQWVQERILDKRMEHPYDDLVRYGVLLRSFDLPLLRAVFPELLDSGDQVFRRLTSYSFIVPLGGGRFAFHNLLRQVQAEYVHKQLPERWLQYHERALRAWEKRAEDDLKQKEQAPGQQPLLPPDYYYHFLALDEQQGRLAWDNSAWRVAIIDERGYWGRFLQAAHDVVLKPGPALVAARAFHLGRFFYYHYPDRKDNTPENYQQAVNLYQQALELYQQLEDPLGEAHSRQGIGDIQLLRREYPAAQMNYTQALALFRQVRDRLGEAHSLRAIGDIQQIQGNYDAALGSYRQALALYEEVGDLLGKANTLRDIGNVHKARNEYEMALEQYKQALELYIGLGERLGEANTLRSIGDLEQSRDDYEAALEHYGAALHLYQEIDERLGEAHTFRGIGSAYQACNEAAKALENHQQALDLYKRLGERLGEAQCLMGMGSIHQAQDEPTKALATYQQALELYHQEGDRLGEASSFQIIGSILQAGNELKKAIASYEQACALYHQDQELLSEAQCLGAIGALQQTQKNYDAALASYQQALDLYRRKVNPLGQAHCLGAIGALQQFQSNYDAALESYQQALKLYRQENRHLNEAYILQAIGALQRTQNNYDAALASYQQAQALYHKAEASLKGKEAECLLTIGELQQLRASREAQPSREEVELALAAYRRALSLFREVQHLAGEAACYEALGRITSERQLNHQRALEIYDRAEIIYRQLDDHLSQARVCSFRSFAHLAEAQRSPEAEEKHLPLAIREMETAVQLAERFHLPQLEAFQQQLDVFRSRQ